ncbi:pollen Ole e 1 allergen and extensin family protein [Striga asiatica]|uniref:Pollen Ole e 1 allergen and extensin family protein n=1 Tax=Striga asiatica TaxID=4170 RepID=A0A5A7R5E3_STRAF|nr:pollen Ole e 1 allergen and extensin family protein [Striga asiatica]
MVTLNGLIVGGQLCCTSTGNCPRQVVSGALISLNCTILGVTTTVGQTTTDINGSFNITVRALIGLVLGLPSPPCIVSVRLPLDSIVCPMLSTVDGALVSTVRSVGTIVTSAFG